MTLAITLLLILLVVAAVSIVLRDQFLNRPRRSFPACGRCGYNLTGNTSNRCPECGGLFIEVGVVTTGDRSDRRGWLAPLLIGVAGFVMLMIAISAFQMLVLRARQAEALARQQALAAQARQPATAALLARSPAATVESTTQPNTTHADADQGTSK